MSEDQLLIHFGVAATGNRAEDIGLAMSGDVIEGIFAFLQPCNMR
jgi:hypothetical protein